MCSEPVWCVVSAGVMGTVEMDKFGDREIDFALWDMTDINSGKFEVKHLPVSFTVFSFRTKYGVAAAFSLM